MITAHEGTQVLDIDTALYLPSDSRRYASIHSNPPGINTDTLLVLNHFGRGRAL